MHKFSPLSISCFCHRCGALWVGLGPLLWAWQQVQKKLGNKLVYKLTLPSRRNVLVDICRDVSVFLFTLQEVDKLQVVSTPAARHHSFERRSGAQTSQCACLKFAVVQIGSATQNLTRTVFCQNLQAEAKLRRPQEIQCTSLLHPERGWNILCQKARENAFIAYCHKIFCHI